jgi:hypothetical protein
MRHEDPEVHQYLQVCCIEQCLLWTLGLVIPFWSLVLGHADIDAAIGEVLEDPRASTATLDGTAGASNEEPEQPSVCT